MKLNANKIKVRLGAFNLAAENEVGSEQRKVSAIQIHPDWNRATDDDNLSDLAILVLKDTVTFTDHIRQVCLPTDDVNIAGSNGFVVGWGLAANNTMFGREILRNDVTTLSNNDVRFQRHRGDSGGGLFFHLGPHSEPTWVQHGIISTIRTDAKLSTATYTNLKLFKDWIHETVSRSGSVISEAKMKIEVNFPETDEEDGNSE